MPNVTPVQSDFSVGEVAPDLQARSTLDAQRRGVKTLTNFVADSRGPAIRRKGFRFLGRIGDPAGPPVLVCGVGTEYEYTGYTDAFRDPLSLTIYNDILFLGKTGVGADSQSAFLKYDTTTDTWTEIVLGNTVYTMAHIAGSAAGSFGVNDKLYLLFTLNGVNWVFRSFNASDLTVNFSIGFTGSNVKITTEGKDRVAFRRNTGFISTYSKADGLSNQTISDPASHDYSMVAYSESTSEWAIFYYQPSTAFYGISFVAENFNGTATAPAEYWDMSSYSDPDDMTVGWEHTIDGDGNIYCFATSTQLQAHFSSSSTTFVLKISSSGALLDIYPFEETGIEGGIASGTVGTSGGIQYFEAPNRVVVGENGTVSEYNPETDTWSFCTVAGVSGSLFGVLDSNNQMWGAQSDGIPTAVKHEIYD